MNFLKYFYNKVLRFKFKQIDFHHYDLDLINGIFEHEFTKKENLIKYILSYSSDSVNFIAEEERAFPGNDIFYKSGYYKTMLKRYFFAGAHFCNNKTVLDTCCGLGWGTYIISQYAKDVTAFDLESKTIEFCKKEWKSSNVNWLSGNALDLNFLDKQMFDVALAMETIEHFDKKDGEKYIELLSKKIIENGILIGTSAFPETRDEAEKICSTNPYHFYIFTEKEMNTLLSQYFKEYVIINNWMFIARK